jgi:YD repeat-containing protein
MQNLSPLALALALFVAAAPAAAQLQQPLIPNRPPPPTEPKPPPDRVEIDPAAPQNRSLAIMDRPLPFRDGQTLHYYDDQGQLTGYARRNKLTIHFYDAQDHPLGRAQRVSQVATFYYDTNGTYLGRRLNRKLVTRDEVRENQ